MSEAGKSSGPSGRFVLAWRQDWQPGKPRKNHAEQHFKAIKHSRDILVCVQPQLNLVLGASERAFLVGSAAVKLWHCAGRSSGCHQLREPIQRVLLGSCQSSDDKGEREAEKQRQHEQKAVAEKVQYE